MAGDLQICPEAFAIDASARPVAVDRRTPRAGPTAEATLAELREPQEISSNGRSFAWVSADRRRLMAWQRGWPATRVVAESEEDNPVTGAEVSGDTVSWVVERTYSADLRSGSFTPMTKRWGGAEASGAFLHTGVPAGSGGSFHPDTSALPTRDRWARHRAVDEHQTP